MKGFLLFLRLIKNVCTVDVSIIFQYIKVLCIKSHDAAYALYQQVEGLITFSDVNGMSKDVLNLLKEVSHYLRVYFL